jgi:dTDP-glucose pyrophosphorylase
MQAVLICGGRGTRLRPGLAGPKSLAAVGGSTLLAGLVDRIGRFHSSPKPPVVVVDAQDQDTPEALVNLLPGARIVRQPRPDGVANALLLAQPLLDDLAMVTLGDLFLDGTFASIPPQAGLAFWCDAPEEETANNFGIAASADGVVSGVIEKPANPHGLSCGMGVYVLTPSVISCFHRAPVDSRTGERGITHGIQAAIEAGVRFRAIPFSGFYKNVNTSADLVSVESYLASPVR